MKAIKFKNFTDRDFTWSFDGIPYTFKAGQEIFLEDFKAYHFGKHLVDDELNYQRKPTNDPSRKVLESKCFPSDEEVTATEALDLNEKAKKPKKIKVEEEEFPDLKVNKKK